MACREMKSQERAEQHAHSIGVNNTALAAAELNTATAYCPTGCRIPDALFHSHALARLLVLLLCQAFHVPTVAFSIIARQKTIPRSAEQQHARSNFCLVHSLNSTPNAKQQRIAYAFIVACCKSPQINSRKELASWSLVPTESTHGKKFAFQDKRSAQRQAQ